MSGVHTNPSGDTEGDHRPSSGFLRFLKENLDSVEDVYKNLRRNQLSPSYYEGLEDRFIRVRKEFKEKLQLFYDDDYHFLNRSEERKRATEQIIHYATDVAERFQEARENQRLDHPRTTDAMEYLINAIKNLKGLSK